MSKEYVPKSKREKGLDAQKGNPQLPEYLEFFEEVERLEAKLQDLPEISAIGTQFFPLMLSRPICILKELCKGASPENLWILPNNLHINEELDLEIVGHDLRIMRARKEKVKVTR